MAHLVIQGSIDLSNPPDIDGHPAFPTGTSFDLVDGRDVFEVTGSGFAYGADGQPIAGTVTGIAWHPFDNQYPWLEEPSWSLSGISWDVASDTSNVGHVSDGVQLFGPEAEWALWLSGDDLLEVLYGDGATLQGFEGNDTLIGAAHGPDDLRGGSGNDVLDGDGDHDILDGGTGNDTLLGGYGSDLLVGGAGDDLIDGGGVLSYEGEVDTVSYAAESVGVTVDLSGITGSGYDGSGTATSAAIGTDTLVRVNHIVGGTGNDSIRGSSALTLEVFEGGAGNDTIDGGAILDPEASNRVSYENSSAAVHVNLQANTATGAATGTDTLVNFDQVRGSSHADTLAGSDRADLVEHFDGRGGADTIDGRGGIDAVRYDHAEGAVNVNLAGGTASDGSGTADTLANIENAWGSRFDDTLVGSDTANWLEGGEGNDWLAGGAGNDTLVAGGGSDIASFESDTTGVTVDLTAHWVEDFQFAGTATSASSGSDILIDILRVIGGSGNDSMLGWTHHVTFEGGAGDDTLDGGSDGDALASYEHAGAAVVVDLEAGTASGLATGNDTLRNVDGVRGSAHDDAIFGTVGGRNDFEEFEGGAGNDTIDGRGGWDRVRYDHASSGLNVNLASGAASNDGHGFTDALANIEEVWGSAFDDVIVAADGGGLLEGRDGNDSLSGGTGDDTLLGGAGQDTLVGGAGDDRISGGWILQSAYYTEWNAVDYSRETASVNVSLQANRASTGSYASGASIGLDNLFDINYVIGGSGNDVIFGSGGALFEQFDGGAGNDTIDGGGFTSADDHKLVTYHAAAAAVSVDLKAGTATGGRGSDVLRNINEVRGSAHADRLVGSDRTDVAETFEGGGGSDTISGGGGVDIVRYDGSAAVNVNLRTQTVSGGSNDVISGIEGVYGGSGNDTLTGGNTASGASFTDGKLEIFRGGAGDDTIDGGAGVDRVDYATSTAGVTVNLGTGSATDGLGGTDKLVGIEAVRGSEFADSIVGSDRSTFATDGYVDLLDGGRGNDTIDGRGGIDVLTYEYANGITVDLYAGTAFDSWEVYTDTLRNIEHVRGTQSLDHLTGDDGNNRLEGLGEDDFLNGGRGADTLVGGTGDDEYVIDVATDVVVETSAGADGGGWDRVNVAFASGTYTLGTFVEDAAVLGKGTVNLVGNAWDNELQGNEAANRLAGGDGDDLLWSNGGDDTLEGGLGDDRAYLLGTLGDYAISRPDALTTVMVRGSDRIELRGIETVYFGPYEAYWISDLHANTVSVFDDIVSGEDGDDSIDALAGNDRVSGEAGNDTLAGGTGNDTLDGGEGNDSLVGGPGADSLVGGSGDDTYVIDATTDLVVEGADAGIDTVRVAFAAAGTYALGSNIEDAVAAGDVNIHLTGNGLGNRLEGNARNNVLRGVEGSDTLVATAGSDTLDGGTGFDVALLDGFRSDYTIVRPTAAQTNFVRWDGTVVLLGVEAVQWSGGQPATPIEDLLKGLGTFGDDTLVGTGDYDLWGDTGDDLLLGGDYDDLLRGGEGADTLRGGAGADLLEGGPGGDTYYFGAGEGDDTLREDFTLAMWFDTLVIDAGSGNIAGGQVGLTRGIGFYDDDMIVSIAYGDGLVSTLTVVGFFQHDAINYDTAIGQIRFTDGNVTLSQAQMLAEMLKSTASDDWIRGYTGQENIDGGEGNDTLAGAAGHDTLAGNLGDDQLSGDDGADLLRAGVGLDTLEGGEGNDVLEGGADNDSLAGWGGADVLLGGAGNDILMDRWGRDTLIGGAGDDTLTGGLEADRFVLNTLDGTDTITDFTPGLDKLAINKWVFGAITGAVSATPTTLEGLGPAFAYDTATGALNYDADGAGGAGPVTVAQLTPGLNLAADFLIVG